MENTDKVKLKSLLHKLNTLGESNPMIRKYFEGEAKTSLASRRDWLNFMDKYIQFTRLEE